MPKWGWCNAPDTAAVLHSAVFPLYSNTGSNTGSPLNNGGRMKGIRGNVVNKCSGARRVGLAALAQ